jgi:hypothetical protein
MIGIIKTEKLQQKQKELLEWLKNANTDNPNFKINKGEYISISTELFRRRHGARLITKTDWRKTFDTFYEIGETLIVSVNPTELQALYDANKICKDKKFAIRKTGKFHKIIRIK